MFKNARIKLTIWYVTIIVIISSLFSFAFYSAATKEIDRIIHRLQFEETRNLNPSRPPRPPDAPSIEELLSYKNRIQTTLVVINGFILLFSAGISFTVAGKTLKPIKTMIDEQNQFISNSSHELRTPLATLRAEMEGKLLEKHITDKDARQLIASNLEELSSLQNLVNNLLKLAQVHNINNGSRRVARHSLSEIIKTSCQKTDPLANQKQIKIKTTLKEAIIEGNKDELIELFVILIDNAIKYSSSKSEITISVTNSEYQAKITIKDNGIGIPKADLPHIYERFYRVDKSRSEIEGYGLGLSIAKKIIESHNGSIAVSSILGRGTTFEVSIPTT